MLSDMMSKGPRNLRNGDSALEKEGVAYYAHTQWRDGRKNRYIRGPYGPDQQTAQRDLEIMRAACKQI